LPSNQGRNVAKIAKPFTPIPNSWVDKYGWHGTETNALGELLESADHDRRTTTSIRRLQARWGWGKDRCSAFIEELVDQNIATIQVHRQGHKRVHTEVDFAPLYGIQRDTAGYTSGYTDSDPTRARTNALPIKEKEEYKNKEKLSHTSGVQAYSAEFQNFWTRWNYPKKSTKAQCFTWWKQHKPNLELQDLIIQGTIAKALVTEDRFMPDPIRYLKYKRWEDQTHQPGDENGNGTGSSESIREGFARYAKQLESESETDGGQGLDDVESDIPF